MCDYKLNKYSEPLNLGPIWCIFSKNAEVLCSVEIVGYIVEEVKRRCNMTHKYAINKSRYMIRLFVLAQKIDDIKFVETCSIWFGF